MKPTRLRPVFTHRPWLPALLVLLLGLFGPSAQAQTTWTGTTSTDWATASNWLGGAVPTATDDVVIPSAPANQPTLSSAGALANSVEVQSGAKLTLASTGSLTINGSKGIGGVTCGFYNNGQVENTGQLTLGNTADLGSYGLYNRSTFNNNAGGQLAIDRCTTYGLYHFSGTFTNAGGITIGAIASVGTYGLYNRSTFNNNAGGQLAIDRCTNHGLYNYDFVLSVTFTNAGGITIGANQSTGTYGLYNGSTFDNKTGGQIAIDRSSAYGLYHFSGTFTNAGGITIGAIASVGTYGLQNDATFDNQAGGQIAIDRCSTFGLQNNRGTLINAGGITLGANQSVGVYGLQNWATFDNKTGGQLAIDRSSDRGLVNTAGTFTNAGGITIGAIASVGTYGLQNDATFDNSGCAALLKVVTSAPIVTLPGKTFSNSGTILENASGTSNITSNTGLVVNGNGGTFTITTDTGLLTTTPGTYWRGCTSTDWATASNWLGGAVPTATDDVVIPPAPANQPTLSTAGAVAKSVEVKSGGKLTITSAGTLTINGFKSSPFITGFYNAGTVDNSGQITLGNTANVGETGLYNNGTFSNKLGGQIAIDRATFRGLANISSGVFTNWGGITIGANQSAGSDGIQNMGSTFDNKSGGQITIDRSTFRGLANLSNGVFTNWGGITIGANQSVGSNGIQNSGSTFDNKSGGQIAIDHSTFIGLNLSGTFTNEGSITIGAIASVGNNGIQNQGTFDNKSGGQIAIDRATFQGLSHSSGTFTNEGRITIGANQSVGDNGIQNQGTFDNKPGGQIAIDRATFQGLFLRSGTFTNAGSIIIGANASVGDYGILNASNFNNSGCTALINIVANAVIQNFSTFDNSGTIIENASGTSTISSNSGVVVNGNGGTFAVGSGPNQPLAMVATNATQCSPANGSIKLTGLKASTPYTLRYTLDGTTTLLSPDSTTTASGELTIPNLGAGAYTLALSGSCLPATLALEATLTGPTPPAVSLTGLAATYCQNAPAVALAGSPAGGNFTVDGNPATQLAPASLSAGPHEVAYTYADPATGCTGSATQVVTVSGSAAVAQSPTTPARLCQRADALPVTFGTAGSCPFAPDNAFTVQLSSATGSFANPRVLGAAQPGTTTFLASALAGLPAGTGYRVRVVTTNPATTSAASAPFRLEGPSLSVTPTVGGAPVCRGQAVAVGFTLSAGSCPFFEGNGFVAQLSSATGSFANPTNLGTVMPGPASPVTIPAGVSAGSGYRIRVVSSSPALTSASSATFQVKTCNGRLIAEETQLVVAPNPAVGGEIRCRVTGLDNPEFSLTTVGGRNVVLSTKTDGSGEFVLTPRQRLAAGVYVLQASAGQTRLTQRVLVAE